MKRLLAASVLLFTAAFAADSAPAKQPNIILILADDLGWNGIGPNGNKDVDTPNLDRLAREGLRFTQAYAETQCSPTRGALMSGRWPARTGLTSVTHEKPPAGAPLIPPRVKELKPDVATLALTLRAAGYTTGLSGKWHIADNYNAAPLIPRKNGKYFDEYGFDYVGLADKGTPKDKATTGITNDLLGFIEKNQARPFFAFFAHNAPHTPMEALKPLVEKYVARGFKRSSSVLCKTAEQPTADYYAMLDHLDASVGRVLAKLDQLGLAENTLVLFYSDNGGLNRMASSAPLRGAKGEAYEGGLRVPLLARWPAVIKPGTTTDALVHAIDFYPTFAELAGAKNIPALKLDGVSFAPVLRGGPATRDTLYWHMPTYTVMYGRTPCAAIRQGDWKLIHYFGDFLDHTGHVPEHEELYGKLVLGPRTELYNLAADLGETTDLAAQNPEKVAALRAQLDAFLKETKAALPKPNPDFDPKNESWWKSAGKE